MDVYMLIYILERRPISLPKIIAYVTHE